MDLYVCKDEVKLTPVDDLLPLTSEQIDDGTNALMLLLWNHIPSAYVDPLIAGMAVQIDVDFQQLRAAYSDTLERCLNNKDAMKRLRQIALGVTQWMQP